MKRIACSVFLLLITYAAWSQHTLKIVVTSELPKQPLAGASVTIPVLRKGAATDSSGKAILKNIPDGSFVVEISFIGFNTVKEKISFPLAKDSVEIDLEKPMKKIAPISL